MRFATLALLMLIACLPVPGVAAPAAETAREVIDYYFSGSDILLVDARLCDRVDDDGPQVHACQQPREAFSIAAGEATYLWLMLMIPQPLDPQTIVIQFAQEGTTFSVQRATVTSSLRYRLWKKLRFDQPGDWQVRILHQQGNELVPLGEITVEVGTPAAVPE